MLLLVAFLDLPAGFFGVAFGELAEVLNTFGGGFSSGTSSNSRLITLFDSSSGTGSGALSFVLL